MSLQKGLLMIRQWIQGQERVKGQRLFIRAIQIAFNHSIEPSSSCYRLKINEYFGQEDAELSEVIQLIEEVMPKPNLVSFPLCHTGSDCPTKLF